MPDPLMGGSFQRWARWTGGRIDGWEGRPGKAVISSRKTEPSALPPGVVKHSSVVADVAVNVTDFCSQSSGTVCDAEMSVPEQPPILTARVRDWKSTRSRSDHVTMYGDPTLMPLRVVEILPPAVECRQVK